MLSKEITDIRNFMHQLLSADTFDRFLLCQAHITMAISWQIDGHIHSRFYDSDNVPVEDYILWQEVRPQIYSILRGNRLPLSMKIILALPSKSAGLLMARTGEKDLSDPAPGMFLNILYQPSGLTLTTGLARSDFSLDKRPEEVFDDAIRSFLKKHGLV